MGVLTRLLALAPKAPAITLPTNAVAWYRGENNTNDVSGLHNASPGAGTAYTTGRDGSCFNFTGNTNQRVLLPTINIGATYTVEFWINPTTLTNLTSYVILGNDFNAASNFGTIYLQGASGSGNIIYYNNNTQRVASTAFMVTGKWYKVWVVYSSSKIKVYVNEILLGTEAGTHSETYNNAAGIGWEANSAGNALGAKVDDLILYNAAKTPATGLKMWYKGDNDATDSGPFAWDATAGVGTAYDTNSSGTANSAFKFNGNANSAVTTPAMIAWDGDTSITFKMYVDASGNSGFRDMIANNWSGGNTFGDIYLNSGKIEYWNAGSKKLQGTTTFSTATWYDIKYTWNSADSKSRLYVNGTLEVTETGTHTESFLMPVLGFARSGGTGAFSGRLDEIKFYNTLV